MQEATISVANGNWIVDGIQLRERKLTPAWLGRFVIWLFFHRIDTRTNVVIYEVNA